MTALDAAIFAKFNTTNALNTALSGRFFPGAADQATSFPYATYNEISSYDDWTFTENIEETLIQFSIFSNKQSPAELNTLYGHLIALFDDAVLTVTGWNLLKFERASRIRLRDIEMETWAYHIDYTVWLEKLRG